MNKRNIALLTAYLAVCTNESDRAILEVALNEYKNGNTPSLPIRVEASLLLGSDELLSEDTDFTSDEFKLKLESAKEQLKYLPIEEHIYSYYSEKKQAQDSKWVDSYSTKLKADGVTDLEAKVVTMTKAFFNGSTLDEILADVDDTQKPYFKKLVKVAIRTQWAEDCINEGKKAIDEDREPVYTDFPSV